MLNARLKTLLLKIVILILAFKIYLTHVVLFSSISINPMLLIKSDNFLSQYEHFRG